MRSWKVAVVLAVISLLLAFALAAAQEPVREFSQLDTRLKPGDKVWVTDAQGREIKGRIVALGADVLTLDAGGSKSFSAGDVRLVMERRHDSLASGALIGLGVGGLGTGIACAASGDEGQDQWCLAAAIVYGGLGAAIGVGIDAMIPGKKLVAYRAPGAPSAASARLSIAPVITPRAKGLAVAFRF